MSVEKSCHYSHLTLASVSPPQDRRQRGGHPAERGGGPHRDPQVLPVGLLQPLADDQDLPRPGRLLHCLCRLLRLKGDDGRRRSRRTLGRAGWGAKKQGLLTETGSGCGCSACCLGVLSVNPAALVTRFCLFCFISGGFSPFFGGVSGSVQMREGKGHI